MNTIRNGAPSVAFAALLIVCVPASAGVIVVDRFNDVITNPQRVSLGDELSGANVPLGIKTDNQGPVESGGAFLLPEVLGHARWLRIESLGTVSGPQSASVAPPSIGLHITNAASDQSMTTVVWSAGTFGLNDPGIGAGDIIGGITNPNQGLLVNIPDPLIGAMNLSFELVSGSSVGPASSFQTYVEDGFSGDVFLPFPEAGGAELTDLFSITMFVTSPNIGFQGTIGSVQATQEPVGPAPVPVPATFPLVCIGLAALTMAKQGSRGG